MFYLIQLEKEKSDLRDRLEKENAELRDKLESARKGLKGNIDDNMHDSNGRINDLATKLRKLVSSMFISFVPVFTIDKFAI